MKNLILDEQNTKHQKISNTQEVHIDIMQNIHEDDKIVIENIIHALESLGSEQLPTCRKYKVTSILTGYILTAKLPTTDVFEISMDDLLYLQSISPARIENIAIGRNVHNAHSVELSLKILNHEQRVMIRSTTQFHSSTRKRKLEHI